MRRKSVVSPLDGLGGHQVQQLPRIQSLGSCYRRRTAREKAETSGGGGGNGRKTASAYERPVESRPGGIATAWRRVGETGVFLYGTDSFCARIHATAVLGERFYKKIGVHFSPLSFCRTKTTHGRSQVTAKSQRLSAESARQALLLYCCGRDWCEICTAHLWRRSADKRPTAYRRTTCLLMVGNYAELKICIFRVVSSGGHF